MKQKEKKKLDEELKDQKRILECAYMKKRELGAFILQEEAKQHLELVKAFSHFSVLNCRF